MTNIDPMEQDDGLLPPYGESAAEAATSGILTAQLPIALYVVVVCRMWYVGR